MSTIDTLDNTQNTPDNILTQEKPSWYSKLSPEKQKEYDSIIDKTSKLEGERKNIIENRSIFFRQIDNVIGNDSDDESVAFINDKNNKIIEGYKREMEIEIELISLNNQVNTILKEIVDVDRKTITTENLLNLKEEERLQYITKEYIKNPTEGDIITFSLTNLTASITAGQALPSNIIEVNSSGKVYKRGENGEFYINPNDTNKGRLVINSGTKIEILKTKIGIEGESLNDFNNRQRAEKLYLDNIPISDVDTYEEFMQLPIEKRMEVVTVGNIKANDVLNKNVNKIKLNFPTPEMEKKISLEQILPPEIKEIWNGFTKYIRGKDGEFYNGKRKSRVLQETTIYFTEPPKPKISSFNDINLNGEGMEPIKNLLDIIAAAELPPSHINNYNVMFGMNDTEKPTFQPTVYMLTEYEPLKNKKLTDMTIGEVMQVQEDFRNKQIELKYKPTTTAMGRYQFMKSTLTSLTSPPFNVNKDLKFSPETQDKLAILLLSDAGVGKGRPRQVQEALAKIWASLPVDNNGRTAYGGDGINGSEALVASSVIRSQLSEIQVA